MPRTVIHWFRRDLRLDDNSALISAVESADFLIPLFILDARLLNTERGGGGPRVAFMLDCLHQLDTALQARGSRLVVRAGDPQAVLWELVQQTGAACIAYNRDYSPYARHRDKQAVEFLRGQGVEVDTYQDLVLHEFKEITLKDKPYQVFTPYRKQWDARIKPQPRDFPATMPPLPPALDPGSLPTPESLKIARPPQPITAPGEAAAHRELTDFIAHRLLAYDEGRNHLDEDGTSRLSPHLRWGTISIRRCYAAAAPYLDDNKGAQTWVSELVWRDFYQMTLAYHPQVLRVSYRPQYDKIQWENDPAYLEAWKAGKTGYPVVDAAMHQLHQTGWMHNRARMIVASFLCKDLLIDWREGEKYFMQHLLDGDSAANNGGWQWAAGTGTDAAPYFRIFNPVTQGEKFDPDGIYVRRWLPVLQAVPDKFVHQPWNWGGAAALDYPPPIVDHAVQRERALAMYGVIKETQET